MARATNRPADVVGSAAPPPERLPRPLPRGASVVSSALAVQLLVALAVAEDRRSADEPRRAQATPTASPTPAPSRSPETITDEEGGRRRRIAVNTARFTASQVCADSSTFVYDVVESSDVIESVISAHDPGDVSGIVVKVTLLQGGYGVSYQVLDERGDCDA